MRGSTIDQARHDIAPEHADGRVSAQVDAAETAAELHSVFPSTPDTGSDHGLWFAIGAGISTAVIAAAVALS